MPLWKLMSGPDEVGNKVGHRPESAHLRPSHRRARMPAERRKPSLLDGYSGLARTRALPRTGHLVRDLGDGQPTMTDRVAARVRRIGSARALSPPERK